ncbi:molybdate ABC transporter substrate-binding protein [Pseudochelatococcus sp. B33]
MRFRVLTTAFLAAFVALAGAAQSQAQTIFAAASMTDAIRQVNELWTAKGNEPFSFSFASSSTLAQQIEQGAEATIFISADERWMDWLQERGLIAEDTRVSALGNRLVLVAPADSDIKVELGKDTDIAALLGADGRLATGDPQHVPVGRYAEQALTALGQWDALAPRLARADSVRSALLLVERGEAPLGIVYATDAAISQGIKVVGVFPEDLHERVTYPFAVVKAADSPAAREALAFLTGDEAAQVYARLGFSKP